MTSGFSETLSTASKPGDDSSDTLPPVICTSGPPISTDTSFTRTTAEAAARMRSSNDHVADALSRLTNEKMETFLSKASPSRFKTSRSATPSRRAIPPLSHLDQLTPSKARSNDLKGLLTSLNNESMEVVSAFSSHRSSQDSIKTRVLSNMFKGKTIEIASSSNSANHENTAPEESSAHRK